MTIVNNQIRLKETRKKLRNNMTDSEKFLWNYLKSSQFEGLKFRRQHSIGRYIVDFYCPKLKLSIELDGGVHLETKEYDNIRTEYLNAYGINEVRFKNEEVLENIETILNKLKNFIKII